MLLTDLAELMRCGQRLESGSEYLNINPTLALSIDIERTASMTGISRNARLKVRCESTLVEPWIE